MFISDGFFIILQMKNRSTFTYFFTYEKDFVYSNLGM